MNKSQLKAKAKEILHGHPLNHNLEPGSSDYNFLLRLFQGHPEYGVKSGAGITGIYIGMGEVYKTRCFFINRLDGSSSDISYIRSVDGGTSKISDIKCACRSAIRDIVMDHRSTVNFGVDTCPITGEILTDDNTHIDHYDHPFDVVANAWIKKYPIEYLHGMLNDATKDNETEIYFTTAAIANDFISFHNRNTHLRAISKSANLSILKQGKKA